MKLFFECNLFEENFKEKESFSVLQNELIFLQFVDKKKQKFKKSLVEYKCEWIKQKDWSDRETIIIPIKDNPDLLVYTLNNLKNNNLDKHCNIVVVDDRSEEDVKTIVLSNNLSYLRIDNTVGFNYSMLMNISGKVCDSLNVKTVIMWNSDLWCVKEEWFLELLKRHYAANSLVSGTKLVYPPKTMSIRGEVDTENIKIMKGAEHLLDGKWRETIQFGGGGWVFTGNNSPLLYSPIHYKRFSDPDNPFVNCDRGDSFVTGALHIWDLKTFIKIGGMNPSMAKNFQDVDACLKVLELGSVPHYFGKDIYFYHDESATLHNIRDHKKFDNKMVSDYQIFAKNWNKKIMEII